MGVMPGLDRKSAAAARPSHGEVSEHPGVHQPSLAAARYVSHARQAIAQLERHLTLLSSAVGDDLAGFESALTHRPLLAPSEARAAIFVIDGDSAVRCALHELLRPHGWDVHTYASAEEFLGAGQNLARLGCFVVEVRLPGVDALALLARLQGQGCSLPVIVMTAQGDVRLAVAAMRAGAADCIEKPIRPDTVAGCVAQVLDRARDRAERALSSRLGVDRIATLTARERQIMDLVVAGHANKEIAARVAISQRTVEKHRASVMRKSGAGSLADLVRMAMVATGPGAGYMHLD